jgi:hypothetical protein
MEQVFLHLLQYTLCYREEQNEYQVEHITIGAGSVEIRKTQPLFLPFYSLVNRKGQGVTCIAAWWKNNKVELLLAFLL